MDALLYSSTLALFTITLVQAQDFFPHGLEYETPVALTPSARNFFNSSTNSAQHQADSHVDLSCTDSLCSPLPQSADVEASNALRESGRNGSITSPEAEIGSGKLSSRGIAGIVVGLVAVGFIAGVTYYVVATRRSNLVRARRTDPHA